MVLILITIGCILGPIGTVVIIYRDNLSGLVVTPQMKQLFSNNDNSNNNGNNNSDNSGNNNNYPDNNNINSNTPIVNNNLNNFYNSGNVHNANPTVNNLENSFSGLGEFNISNQTGGSQVSEEISANIDCLIEQDGNNIQLSFDLHPTNVPNDLQSISSQNRDYVFNFAGTTFGGTSITQITANAQGSFNSGEAFSINLNGSFDQNQNTLTFSWSSAQNSQVNITTLQSIDVHRNGNNNLNNNNSSTNDNVNSTNVGENNNDNGPGLNQSFISGQINTSQKTITLTFSLNNEKSSDQTLNSMSGTIVITNDQTQLGIVSLQNAPITIHSGQTIIATVSGAFTSSGQNDLSQNYKGVSTIDVSVVNGEMTVNGVIMNSSGNQEIGVINVTN